MTSDIRELERYFRDPKIGDKVLTLGASSIACKNIRLALRMLDLHDSLDFKEIYDSGLANDILRFQKQYAHISRDGQFGPGTRRLLTQKVIEKVGKTIFKRMVDPERRDEGQVFVSYARTDATAVQQMVSWIGGNGFNVWYDQNIAGSEHFNASIQQAIEASYLVIVCLSNASVNSKWVEKEVMFAECTGKEILPVLLDVVPPAHPLKLVLVNVQTLDASEPSFSDRLLTSVKSVHARHLPK